MRMSFLVLAGLATSMSASAHATTIINEDFESGFGVFVPNPLFNAIVLDESAYASNGNPGTNAADNAVVSFGAGNGNAPQFFPSQGLVSSAFNLVGGVQYALSFDYGVFGAPSSGSQILGFLINGTGATNFLSGSIGAASTSTDLNVVLRSAASSYQYFFTPNTSGAYNLTFAGGGSAGDNADGLLDNVLLTSVSAAPEPATWAMMLLGFGAAGYSMRRSGRSRAKALATA